MAPELQKIYNGEGWRSSLSAKLSFQPAPGRFSERQLSRRADGKLFHTGGRGLVKRKTCQFRKATSRL